jgi:hypothetical protein
MGRPFAAAVRPAVASEARAFRGAAKDIERLIPMSAARAARQTGSRIRQALDRTLDQVSEINRTVAERRLCRPTRRGFPARESSKREPCSPTVPRSDSA